MDLLIDTYGTKIGASGERIVLSFPGQREKKEYPVRRLKKILILRPASLTTKAVELALEYDIDIAYLGAFGKPVGRIFSSEPKGLASLRRAQLDVSTGERGFALVKTIINSKCSSQIAYIRYLGYAYAKDFSTEILQAETLRDTIDRIPFGDGGKGQLLGTEGYIADKYFLGLRKLFRFSGRKPQGRDKFNSALNYGYGILYNEVERMCLYVGLDPYLGLYHSERYGKPALVCDLVEEFRVSAIDMAIFPLFIEKKLSKRSCFEFVGRGQYQLSQEGKSIVIKAVMESLDRKVHWRGKTYTQKAVIENQIRALARYFTGAESKYTPFDVSKAIPA